MNFRIHVESEFAGASHRTATFDLEHVHSTGRDDEQRALLGQLVEAVKYARDFGGRPIVVTVTETP